MSSELIINNFSNYGDFVNVKAKQIHQQIAALKIWVDKNKGDNNLLDKLCTPYYEILKELYEDEMPYANAVDTSDLVIRLEGPFNIIHNPKISLITGIFSSVRRQVTNLTKAFANLGDLEGPLPKELDLGLSAVAKGSLVLGFTLPVANLEDRNGQPSLLGEQDPLYQASKNAIRALGIVTKHVAEDKIDDINEEIDDPKIRDVALIAAKNIAPSGRNGIERVSVASKEFPQRKSSVLTLENRREIKKVLKEPVKSTEVQTFEGIVREIDLDANRFELRRISGFEIEDIRCIYLPENEDIASHALNNRIRVTGRVDRSPSGKPRLLKLARLEVI